MEAFICRTCGVQYAPSERPPERCPICEDERQYVGWNGQQWTTMAELIAEGRQNHFYEEEPGLHAIDTRPQVSIGQRALLVQTPNGNVMWDCVTLVDDASIEAVRRLGGLAAIAISHPHFYASNVAWSRAFGDCPVYVHAADRQWVQRPSRRIEFFDDEVEPVPGLTVARIGGHFDGAAVLHWPAGSDGRGALLTGDTITVVQDRDWVSFMWSYPNLVPLPAREVERIASVLATLEFDRIYGAWWDRVIDADAKAKVARSAARYVEALERVRD